MRSPSENAATVASPRASRTRFGPESTSRASPPTSSSAPSDEGERSYSVTIVSGTLHLRTVTRLGDAVHTTAVGRLPESATETAECGPTAMPWTAARGDAGAPGAASTTPGWPASEVATTSTASPVGFATSSCAGRSLSSSTWSCRAAPGASAARVERAPEALRRARRDQQQLRIRRHPERVDAHAALERDVCPRGEREQRLHCLLRRAHRYDRRGRTPPYRLDVQAICPGGETGL